MLSGEALDLAFALRDHGGPMVQGDGPRLAQFQSLTRLSPEHLAAAVAELASVGFIAVEPNGAYRRIKRVRESPHSPRYKFISTISRDRVATTIERSSAVLRTATMNLLALATTIVRDQFAKSRRKVIAQNYLMARIIPLFRIV